ncbi:MAG: DNA translocase FtsK 4TM domain-containing protein, partial [bacterium]
MANRDKRKYKKDNPKESKEYKRGPYKLSTEEDEIEQKVLKPSTIQSVWGIAMFVLAIFFLFASLNRGGSLGNIVYSALSKLLGLGYYLIPLVFIMLSIAFFGERNRKFYLSKSLGALLFLLSTLGVISLINLDSGGFVGQVVAIPLVKLFDYPTSYVITIALSLISILIIYDSSIKKEHLMFWRIFSKKNTAEEGSETTALGDGTIKATEDEKITKSIKEAEASAAGNKAVQDAALAKTGGVDSGKDGNSKTQDQNKTNGASDKTPKDDESIDLKAKSTWSGKAFIPPPLSILEQDKGKPGVGDIKANANIIKRTLQNFGIDVEMDEVSIGPSVTRYALKPAEG